ncbi:hypothetical protein [Shimia abyssi]|uniref:Lipoprotein n=1 Tax=Shimia abyssi TaxID=1662395 RepID=A0A2P8F6G6_9RHOB|nr:hypothetical protein [Shimia abyssi]PSL17314.1 hypothetical protein CLV88_11987 [Shimia abyssi]
MKKVLVLAMAGTTALTAACSTNPDGSTSMGMKESPAWHATTSTQNKVAHFKSECQAYGYEQGSPHLAQCVQMAMEGSKSRATTQFAAGMASAAAVSAANTTRSVHHSGTINVHHY